MEYDKKSLKDMFDAPLACSGLVLVFGLVARLLDRSMPAPLLLLLISAFLFIIMFLVCSGTVMCCALSSLYLLRRQEKVCHFSFSKE